MIDKLTKKFLNNIFHPKQAIPTVAKKVVYLKVPYVGPYTAALQRNLSPILKRTFPACRFVFVPTSSFSISRLFPFKDKIPQQLRSSLIYLYTCASCQARYVGQTGLQLKIRVSKHKGLSFQTDRPLNTLEYSPIRQHALQEDHPIIDSSFK